MQSFLPVVPYALFWACLSYAQQFSDLPMPPSWPGISTPCLNALNTTLSCPGFLGVVSINNERLTPNNLTSLCTTTCQTSLNNVRQTIQQACTNTSTDHINYDGTIYPATYIADRFLYTYKLACRKDPTTGQFCDTILSSWLNQSSLTAAQNCSDCLLGADQTQLNSPFGYAADYAADFQSRTSSCGVSGYTYTVPPLYTLNPTTSTTVASTTAVPATTCTSSYIVQVNDTCNSIAQANNVSTFSVSNPGSLDADCDSLPTNITICLASSCNLYYVQANDTCATIISAQGNTISGTQLLAWNPNINALCGNLFDLQETYICVSPPGGTLGNVVPTSTLAISTVTTPVPKPTNAFPQSNSNCGRWYTVQAGDYCDKVSVTFGIALVDFYFLNPEIYSNCTNLILGVSYCVQPVGNIATYSGYSTSYFFTLTATSYSTLAATTVTDYPAPSIPSTSQLPVASGSLKNCSTYQNYQVIPPILDQSLASESTDSSFLTNYANDCNFLATTFGVNITDFLSWNPSLPAANCTLQSAYSYCMELTQVSNSSSIAYSPACYSPTSIHNGTTSYCNCFTAVYGYDNGTYLCSDIASDYQIAVTDIINWNPWVGSDCDTGLYTGLANSSSSNAICVGVNSTVTTTTSSTSSSKVTSLSTTSGSTTKSSTTKSTPSTTTSKTSTTTLSTSAKTSTVSTTTKSSTISTTTKLSTVSTTTKPSTTTSTHAATTTSTTISPTQSGIISTCTKYYTVKSGDSCAAIETTYSITFAQFYAWNPAVGSGCQSLFVGYAYCVAAPASSSSTTTPAGPTRSGTPSTCTTYYTVQSGDSCASIETKYGITFATLYKWNPSIGSNCESLWVGYSVCVAGGP